MSNSMNPNGIITNSNNIGARDGTRVVLREITANLQNSPPMQPGIRKVANNAQTGKTEHEVKVQFTREFVDAGAPNSRPESLSSSSSFQSLSSTISTKSEVETSPITPQRAADTSYINTDIPGLDDLIAACGNIRLNDKLDTDETGETETFQSLADSTLTITANDNSFPLKNTLQNLSQEEEFSSVISDSSQLNGTHDLSLDYKEACEKSINLNDTREAGLDNKLENLNGDPVKNFLPTQTEEDLITNHIKDSPDIPQSSVDNSLLNETRDLSSKSDIADGFSLNKTVELASASQQVDNNLSGVEASSPSLNASKNLHSLNQTSETLANCNSNFVNLNTSKSDVLNLTHDLPNDDKNLSIDCNSQNTTDIRPDQSFNELSANEADGNVSSLNDPLNLPPESDGNISTTNLQILPNSDVLNLTESFNVNESSNAEYDLAISRSGQLESVKNFDEQNGVPESQIVEDQCIPDSSTDHLTDLALGFADQIGTATSSSIGPEIHENINTEFLKDAIAEEEARQISDNHNVSTTVTLSEEKPEAEENLNESEPAAQSQEIAKVLEAVETEILNTTKPDLEPEKPQVLLCENSVPKTVESEILNTTKSYLESEKPQVLHCENSLPKAVESEILNTTKPDLESEKPQVLPGENLVDQPQKTPEKRDSVETVLPVSVENIVPCDSLNNLQELEVSKSEELPQVVINVTPFPGYNSESREESTLNAEGGGSHNSGSSLEQDSNQTITVKEESFHSIESEGAGENYNAFQPEKQSTSLNIDSHFIKLELAAQGIAEEIRNKSLELTEDSDQFFNADSDLFLDTASVDFFLTRNNSKNSIRDLRAESLYVKFDPLVSNVSMLPQGPPQVVDGEENAKNSIPQPTLDTPKRNPALAAIDRLLFYSPATGTPNKVEEPPKIEEKIVKDDIPEAIPIVDETMAKELELVRSTVLQLDSQLEKQKKEHEEELEKQRLKYKELEQELAREVQKKNETLMVMDEYEKSLSRHMSDSARERATFEQERAKLQEELQAANHHLGNTEAAFNDVHSKYERLKSVVSAYKSNEDVLKESVQENVETIKTLEARYEQLKSHAMTQLEKANLELEAIRKQHETETVRLQAMIRKAELKSNSLAEMVEQKSKENKELAEILDEVIARVGRSPE